MENYREHREKVIREILKYVYEHKSLPESAYDWDTAAIVKECVDKNFLGNIETTTCLDGRVHISAACPFVTAQGLEFLCQPPYEETTDGRLERCLKDISENMESLEELKRIADAAEKHAKVAVEEAQSAKTDARFSKIISVLALLVSAGSLIVAAISLSVG